MKTKNQLLLIFLILLSFFTYSQNDRKIDSIFLDYIRLNEKYLESKELFDRVQLEKFAENELLSALNEFENQMIHKFNEELFSVFLQILIYTSNSNDETPIDILGNIYIRYPNSVLSTVNKTNHNEKLISLLNFGLEINYFKLKEKLKMK